MKKQEAQTQGCKMRPLKQELGTDEWEQQYQQNAEMQDP